MASRVRLDFGQGTRRLLATAAALAWLVPGPAAAADAQAQPEFRCGLGEPARGLSADEAATVAQIVCEELRRQSGGRGGFDLVLGTLGRKLLLTAAREDTGASVTVQSAGAEEVPVLAPRLAEALVQGRPLAATQRVDNLLEAETREALTKKGAVKFTLGIANAESIGHGARASSVSLGLMYSAPRFALPAQMRFAWDDASAGEARFDFFSISIGGRAYLTKRDTSPFVGAGVGILRLSAGEGGGPYDSPDGSTSFDGRHNGVAPYVEAGVEMLRLHRGRVALEVRADIPTGSVQGQEYRWLPGPGRPGDGDWTVVSKSRYLVPVTIGVAVAF